MMFNASLILTAKRIFNSITLLGFFLVLLLSAGCKTLENGAGSSINTSSRQLEYSLIEGGGWLSVFLNLGEQQNQEVTLEIEAVEVKAANNWISISSSPLAINTAKLGTGQILLARNMVPSYSLSSIRLFLKSASVKRNGQKEPLNLNTDQLEIQLPAGLSFSKGASHSLFITWDVASSFSEGDIFLPDMKSTLQGIPLLKDLLFLACPDIDTVYVVRTDRNWVISSLGVPGRPTYLDVDEAVNRLYILTTEESVINVVDLTTFKVIDKIFLTLDLSPTFMVLGSDKQYAYVLDGRGRNIAKVNLASGSQEERVNLAFEPKYVTPIENQNLLGVSASDTNRVYLLNPQSLLSVNSLSVGSFPDGLLSWTDIIFVAESGTGTVSAYNLQDGTQLNRVNVGRAPARLFLKENQLYVSDSQSGLLTVMLPGQLIVSGEIFVGGNPMELAGSESRRWIYTGDVVKGGVIVIDPTINRIARYIDLATPTLGLAVLD